MKKYKYCINNLDCANCAREVEESLKQDDRFSNVSVNFSTLKLSYETEYDISLKELNTLVQKVEPDVTITQEEVNIQKEFHLWILMLGIIVGLLGYFLNGPSILKMILLVISYILLLYRTFINAMKLLWKSRTINENFLITISCIGAFLIGEQLEGIMVITLYTIGKLLEEKALNNSRRSIKDLVDIKENFAYKKEGKVIKKIEVENIKIGDILVVKKGEKIPVDGVIVKGKTFLDMSSLSGESNAIEVCEKDNILSGSINIENVIEMKATSLFEDSIVSKILELLEEATDKKTKTETLISKISKIYTPVVLLLALFVMIFLPLFTDLSIKESVYRGLTFLVISCPCAIAISVPLSYFTGIGVASKNGILIKGSSYLDNLSELENIIFDKTGTLTNGSFEVSDIKILDDHYTKEEIIDILVKGESLSYHPIANSIVKLRNEKIDNSGVIDYKEIEGKGISYTLNNQKILIGNKAICNCLHDTTLHLNINGKHIASIEINDGIKNNAKKVISWLKELGIKTFMFTGDKKRIALNIGNKLEIDEIKYEMLPTDKFKNYELVAQNKKMTAFVGDGVNDAPVLKRADIGISMGSVGSESAIEASDIVLIGDDLSKIPLAISISRYTKKIIKQNLIFAILTKIIILGFSILGIANMWFAVFADTGVTLITIVNTLRIIKKYKK